MLTRNCTRPHNSCTVGRHKQRGFFTLKGVVKNFPFKKFQTIVLKRSLCPLRWLLLTFFWRQTPWIQWFGSFKLGSYPRPPITSLLSLVLVNSKPDRSERPPFMNTVYVSVFLRSRCCVRMLSAVKLQRISSLVIVFFILLRKPTWCLSLRSEQLLHNYKRWPACETLFGCLTFSSPLNRDVPYCIELKLRSTCIRFVLFCLVLCCVFVVRWPQETPSHSCGRFSKTVSYLRSSFQGWAVTRDIYVSEVKGRIFSFCYSIGNSIFKRILVLWPHFFQLILEWIFPLWSNKTVILSVSELFNGVRTRIDLQHDSQMSAEGSLIKVLQDFSVSLTYPYLWIQFTCFC